MRCVLLYPRVYNTYLSIDDALIIPCVVWLFLLLVSQQSKTQNHGRRLALKAVLINLSSKPTTTSIVPRRVTPPDGFEVRYYYALALAHVPIQKQNVPNEKKRSNIEKSTRSSF